MKSVLKLFLGLLFFVVVSNVCTSQAHAGAQGVDGYVKRIDGMGMGGVG